MRKQLICLIVMIAITMSISVKAYDCLPNKLKYVKQNQKYQVLTVKGKTYLEAKSKLRLQMPEAGFLQQIRSKEVQKLTNRSYQRQLTLSKSLKANVDLWLKYDCQYQGDYYITAILSKEDVHYLSIEYPTKMSISYVKKICKGYNKIFIIMADVPYDFVADRNKLLKDPNGYWWRIMCGNVKIHAEDKWNHYNYDNTFDNFKAIQLYSMKYGQKIDKQDISIDLWLELTKGF